MLLPSESSLTDALPFPALIAALRDAFAAGADVPLRHTHHIGIPLIHVGRISVA